MSLVGHAAAAETFTRSEVEAAAGAPVDGFNPTAIDGLGVPYRPEVHALIYLVGDDEADLRSMPEGAPRYHLVVFYDEREQIILARRKMLGNDIVPVHNVTEFLKRILRRRRA